MSFSRKRILQGNDNIRRDFSIIQKIYRDGFFVKILRMIRNPQMPMAVPIHAPTAMPRVGWPEKNLPSITPDAMPMLGDTTARKFITGELFFSVLLLIYISSKISFLMISVYVRRFNQTQTRCQDMESKKLRKNKVGICGGWMIGTSIPRNVEFNMT